MITIEAVSNGYLITSNIRVDGAEGAEKIVIEESEEKDVDCEAIQRLLYSVMEYFGLLGSKHDPERIRIVIEKKDVDY